MHWKKKTVMGIKVNLSHTSDAPKLCDVVQATQPSGSLFSLAKLGHLKR